MTARIRVRVRDRAAEAPWGSGLTSPVIRTVEISATCPRCGGPRGEPRNQNQVDDGAHYSVDVWANPCGHVDAYAAVIAEARQLTPPSAANLRNRILARYGRLMIAAHDRGELTPAEVWDRGRAAARRIFERFPTDRVYLTAEEVQNFTRRNPPRNADGELEEPTPADEEGWDARDDWNRGSAL